MLFPALRIGNEVQFALAHPDSVYALFPVVFTIVDILDRKAILENLFRVLKRDAMVFPVKGSLYEAPLELVVAVIIGAPHILLDNSSYCQRVSTAVLGITVL